MKVRCNNDLGVIELEVGKIYEGELKFNEWFREYRWYIKGIERLSFKEQFFEIVKDDNMKKTFREVITDIKEREVWICEKFNRKIIKGDDGVIEIRALNDKTFDNISALIFNDEIYELQRQQYSFKEAFKAYEEGWEIESCYNQYKYKKINGIDLYSKTENDLYDVDSFGINEIRGKWYINN